MPVNNDLALALKRSYGITGALNFDKKSPRSGMLPTALRKQFSRLSQKKMSFDLSLRQSYS